MMAVAALVAVAALAALGPAAPAPKTVVQVDKTWVCDKAVDLDMVSVTMTAKAASGPRSEKDAVHLQPGCTGRIGELDVTTSVADGVKVAYGVHDLVVEGGAIRCLAKAPTLHQDGIQVMGGDRITFKKMKIDCGRLAESLINSNLFINMAGRASTPPTDVVCDQCSFGGGAAHTVSVQNSIRSGVSNSTLCRGKFPALTLSIGKVAVDPVNVGNTLKDCPADGTGGGGTVTTPGTTKLTLSASTPATTFGKPVTLSGSFKDKVGRRVTLSARPFGAGAFTAVTTVATDAKGAWRVVVHPKVSTSYRADSRATASPVILVGLRPRIVATLSHGQLRVRVTAKTSFRGRGVVIQKRTGTGWASYTRRTLGAGGTASVPLTSALHGTSVRVLVPAAPGYLSSVGAPLAVR